MKALNNILDVIFGFIAAFYYGLEKCVLLLLPIRWRAKDVSKEIVLITGGGSGLGRLLAKGFAKLGSKVVVWDVNEEGNEETVKQILAAGGKAYSYKCDVSKPENVRQVAQQVKKEVGPVTILINNAGIVNGAELSDLPDEKIQRIFNINVLAHFWTTKTFLPDMMKNNHGHIVTIASLAGYFGSNRLVDYCSTKFAAVGFDESLRAELSSKGLTGINTTCICPFYINTGMFDGVQSKVLPILQPEYVAKQIINSILVNEEVLIIPRSMIFFMVLKMMLPIKGSNALVKAFGSSESMNSFHGHHPVKTD